MVTPEHARIETCLLLLLIAIVGETVREKLRTDTKCTSVIRYVFQWETLTSFRNHLPVKRGILRVYMQVISRLITNDEVATVTVGVSVNTFSNKSNITSEVHLEESVITDKQEINVTDDSNGWQEINITNALHSIWPPNEDTSIVEIVLRLEVDCKERKKIPVNFVNPAEISLEQVNRRERYEALQPLMLVFLDDNEIKEKMKKEKEAGRVAEQESDVTLLEGKRRRRTTYTHICRMENFTINFGELGLSHVLFPHSVNIRRCSGSCSHNAIKLNGHIATNHAKMMASTYRLHQLNLISSQAPREPCCVPVKYRYQFLLTQHRNQATQLRAYPDFVVEGCGCR